ncbi:Outer membrane receptor proteins, mostly Fe transport [Reichenbachiella agariperforans]|uniref:Outer membrane receptor proteins, mostly Fe transport n=1 Tax=Reichenbachiella agariperforans TaxID=156994 RepID=A0A1M6UDA3_REIAG|nr:TonB-dependent receptor [Reichenbachiella agariperforans]SHK67147.1 Outer membrane receptor proteins, mostly Fe transport [Reichenbachiella agariperforans]
MKRLSILSLLCTLTSVTLAQSTISGKLVDSAEKSPIEFASVALYQQSDSSLVTGTVSNTDGSFTLSKIKTGQYYLNIQFMGFQGRFVSDLSLSRKEDMELGVIELTPDDQLLQELVVSGQKVTTMHKIDRQVYEADQFQSSQGGTATDVLRNMPSVSLNAEGDISVRGSTGFVVLLNGQPVQSDPKMLLSQLPANSIQNVEVITAPSAKYDSEGKSGIINIVTTQNATDGLFAQINTKIGLPSIESYDNKEAAQRYGADFTLNYRKNKWDFALGAAYLRNDKSGRREGDVWTEIGDKRTEFPSDGERSFDEKNYSGRLAIGFRPDENNDFNVSFYGGKRSKDRTADIYYDNKTYHLPDGTQTGAFDYYNENLRIRTSDFALGSFDYSHRFANSSQISVSALYEYTLLGGPTTNRNLDSNWPENQTIYDDEYNTNDNPLYGTRFNLDYEFAPSKWGQWTIGYQFRNLDHQGDFYYEAYNFDSDQWEMIPEYSSNLNLKRSIHSGYVNLSGEKGKWNYGIGVRSELMDRQLDYQGREAGAQKEVLNYDYFRLFPSASLQYAMSEDLKLKAAYSKRVERTTTFKMNPFKEKEHSETLEQGDANLLPEFIDLVELGVIKEFNDHSVFATAYFRHTQNVINRVNTVDSDTVLNRIYTNIGTGQAIGLEIGSDLQLNKWWKLYAGGNIYNYHIDGTFNNANINTSAWQYNLNVNTTFQLTSTLDLQWSLNYLSERVTAQGKDSRYYSPNLTLRKTFLDDRLTTTLQWINMDMGLLDTNEQRITTSGNYIDPADSIQKTFYTTTNYVYEVDMIMINISFKFNKLKNKAKFAESEFGDKEF